MPTAIGPKGMRSGAGPAAGVEAWAPSSQGVARRLGPPFDRGGEAPHGSSDKMSGPSRGNPSRGVRWSRQMLPGRWKAWKSVGPCRGGRDGAIAGREGGRRWAWVCGHLWVRWTAPPQGALSGAGSAPRTDGAQRAARSRRARARARVAPGLPRAWFPGCECEEGS
eukprot:scaffold4372_cov397-Prasinococcus_capsulatus_cf.AAC.43